MRIKRALSLLLAVLMAVSLLAVGSAAADQLTVVTKSNGRRTLAVGETFTYSFAIRLQRPYDIDSIEADILYDPACLELTSWEFPAFKSAPTDHSRTGDLYFKKGTITNHSEFSQTIQTVVTCTFKVTRGGTTYIRPLIANLEAEAGTNNDAFIVQSYRPDSVRQVALYTYDYLDTNKPTSGTTKLNVNEDVIWFYVTDAADGNPVPAGVKFVLSGTDDDGNSRSYTATTDEYGMICFPHARMGEYFVRCDTTNDDGTTYLVNDPAVSIPNVENGELVIDNALSVQRVPAGELKNVTVAITWTGEEIEPGVTYTGERPANVYLSLRSGDTVVGQQYVSGTAKSALFERVPINDADGNPVAYTLITGAMEQYDAFITETDTGFAVEFRYKNDHTWQTERTEPTCTQDGSILFVCSDCGKTFSQTLSALGHDYAIYGYDADCTREGYHRYQCRRCDHWYVETEPKTAHNWSDWIVDKEVTADEDGLRHRVCLICGEREDQIWASPVHEHDFRTVVVPPTCTEPGYSKRACGCGVEERIPGSETPALGHDYTGDSHTVTVISPTCTEEGLEEWTCSRCGEIHAEPLPATGHDYQVTGEQEPTCTDAGYKDMKCANCGETRHVRIAPLGHDWGEWETVTPATTTSEGVKIRTCNRCGEQQTGTIPKLDHVHSYTQPEVVAPTCEEQGYTKMICPDDGAFIIDENSYVPALGHALVERWRQEPTTKTQGLIDYVCSRCGKHEFVTIPIIGDDTPVPGPGGFYDVKTGDYFADAVTWAVANGVTNGVDSTHFAPKRSCTRAQTVTFLWRANGMPEPTLTTSPFTDVQNPNAYYYKAVLWAVEQGITNGTTATTFSPNDTVTRAQVVTFLWRSENSPAPAGTGQQFGDVLPDAYYADAVQWAVEQGITNGIGAGQFGPKQDCTRAQIVTFLFRNETR